MPSFYMPLEQYAGTIGERMNTELHMFLGDLPNYLLESLTPAEQSSLIYPSEGDVCMIGSQIFTFTNVQYFDRDSRMRTYGPRWTSLEKYNTLDFIKAPQTRELMDWLQTVQGENAFYKFIWFLFDEGLAQEIGPQMSYLFGRRDVMGNRWHRFSIEERAIDSSESRVDDSVRLEQQSLWDEV